MGERVYIVGIHCGYILWVRGYISWVYIVGIYCGRQVCIVGERVYIVGICCGEPTYILRVQHVYVVGSQRIYCGLRTYILWTT